MSRRSQMLFSMDRKFSLYSVMMVISFVFISLCRVSTTYLKSAATSYSSCRFTYCSILLSTWLNLVTAYSHCLKFLVTLH